MRIKAKGAGSLYRRGTIWWIRYGFRGRDVRESSGGPRQGEARKLLKRRLGEVGRGGWIGPDEDRLPLTELLDALVGDYEVNGRRSLSTLRGRLAHLRSAFGLDRARDVTESRIEQYKRDRLAEKASAATVNRELTTLKRAFRLGMKQKRLSFAPSIEMLAEAAPRQGFCDPHQLETVVTQLPEDLRDFTRFAYLTGWRKGEIATLSWSDVDREAGRITLRRENSKNCEPRVLPLSGGLAALGERRWAARPVIGADGSTHLSALVFHRDGRRVGDIRKAWTTACRAARIPGLLFHDLRRSAVRNFEKAGVSQAVAMRLSGHRTASVYRRYRIVDERDLADALTRTHDFVAKQAIGANVTSLRPSQDPSGAATAQIAHSPQGLRGASGR